MKCDYLLYTALASAPRIFHRVMEMQIKLVNRIIKETTR